MLFPAAPYSIERNSSIEGHELTAVVDGHREKVDVGQLTGAVYSRRIEYPPIEYADVVGPELM